MSLGSATARCLILCTALTVVLTGCGADKVESRARANAEASFPPRLTRAVECLASHASGLLAAPDTDALATELTECAGTGLLNASDDAPRTARPLDTPTGTLALASEHRGADLHLHLYTSGIGGGQAGVTQAVVILGTCWQVTVKATGELGEPSADVCSEVLIAQANPTEVVPFDEIDLTAQ